MEYQEYEINIHKLLYRICRQWRKILVAAVIIAAVLGAREAYEGFSVLNNKKALNTATISFEREHAAWAVQGISLNRRMENLLTDKERQETYNEKSLLMQFDPLDEHYGAFSVYVDAGYTVDPGSSVQNIDYTQRILAAYYRFYNTGELFEYIIDHSNITDDQQYLKEIMNYAVNYDSSTITVSTNGASTAQVKEILSLARDGIIQKYDTIYNNIHPHTYSIVNEIEYGFINYDLDETQRNNIDRLEKYDLRIKELNEEMDAYLAQKEPSFRYVTSKIIKRAIKQGILGAIVGIIVGMCWFAARNIFTQKFQDDKLSACAGLGSTVVGTIAGTGKKKKLNFIDRAIVMFFGENEELVSFDDSCAIAGSNLGGIAASRGADRIALIGNGKPELLADIGARLNAAAGCSVDAVGSLLTDPEAARRIKDYDNVVVAASELDDTLSTVSRQYELLRLWGKDPVGALILK